VSAGDGSDALQAKLEKTSKQAQRSMIDGPRLALCMP
jgi:hypothetical protein